jgi:tetratricopeptide (TPR) repeat protein
MAVNRRQSTGRNVSCSLLMGAIVLASATIQYFHGGVHNVDGQPISQGDVQIEGAGAFRTSDSGEFDFPQSKVLDVDSEAVFHVTHWVVVQPCDLKNGRIHLPPFKRQIEITVLARSDKRLINEALSALTIHRCLIEEMASQFVIRKYPGATGKSASRDRKESTRSPVALRQRAYDRRGHWAPARYGVSKHGFEKFPNPVDFNRSEFLVRKAEELGFPEGVLLSAIEAWAKAAEAAEDPYDRALAALHFGHYSDASHYLSHLIESSSTQNLKRYVLLARAEYELGNLDAAESALKRVLARYPRDSITLNDLDIVRQTQKIHPAGPTPFPPSCDTLHNRGTELGLSVPGVVILPIPKMPFSSRETIEWSKSLDDGTLSCRSFYTIVARDRAGRIRREFRRFIRPLTIDEPEFVSFTVFDPQERLSTECVTSKRICYVRNYNPPSNRPADWEPRVQHGDEEFLSLGTSKIDGIPVVGDELVAIPHDLKPDEASITTSKEIWHSDPYKMNVYEVRVDPRIGTITLRLTDCKFSDPDPKLFALPSDFEIVDERRAANP